jgi:hypothetical protein
MQNSNQMHGSFDLLEVFNNTQGIKLIQSGIFIYILVCIFVDSVKGSSYPNFNPIRITNSIIRNNDKSDGAPLNGCGIALIRFDPILHLPVLKLRLFGFIGLFPRCLILSSVVQLLNMTIKNNLCAMGHGGGLYVGASSILYIENTSVTNNVAAKGGGKFK